MIKNRKSLRKRKSSSQINKDIKSNYKPTGYPSQKKKSIYNTYKKSRTNVILIKKYKYLIRLIKKF